MGGGGPSTRLLRSLGRDDRWGSPTRTRTPTPTRTRTPTPTRTPPRTRTRSRSRTRSRTRSPILLRAPAAGPPPTMVDHFSVRSSRAEPGTRRRARPSPAGRGTSSLPRERSSRLAHPLCPLSFHVSPSTFHERAGGGWHRHGLRRGHPLRSHHDGTLTPGSPGTIFEVSPRGPRALDGPRSRVNHCKGPGGHPPPRNPAPSGISYVRPGRPGVHPDRHRPEWHPRRAPWNPPTGLRPAAHHPWRGP